MTTTTRTSLAEAAAAPWAIRRDALPHVARRLTAALQEDEVDQEAPPEPEPQSEGGIAVLPIRGTILQRWDQYGMGDGAATFLEPWLEAFEAAVADPDVKKIVLDVSSPGGIVWGVPEAAARIRAGAKVKPVVGVANAQADSAAYWLLTAASERFVTPSGEVGSVGVWSMHMDASDFFEDLGIKVTLISEGEHKVDGNPFEPLSDEAREYMQAQTRRYYEMFVDGVAENMGTDRDTVEADFGQGRTVLAEEAVKRGMVDGIATLGEVVARLQEDPMDDEEDEDEMRGHTEGVELRGVEAEIGMDADRQVAGSVPFGSLSLDLGGFVERFAAGAFDDSLAADDQLVLWQHDPRHVFGRRSAGTASFEADEAGLRYSASPPDAQWAKDAVASIARGDVRHSSFSFIVPEPRRHHERWERRDGRIVRTVLKARLVEAGPQTFAAYQESEAAAKASADGALDAARAEGRIETPAPARELRKLRLRVTT